ncbi:hypothetical protein R3P38DRAFT_3282911 [Favolaschia claudopus]|uniref:Uncharacterized protein n=1 Tax=Favolaschia claudopus TaxID=2862362 RepID=A0AAW0A9I3_9AGAR
MSSTSPAILYIRLQAIPATLLFLVPLATLALFFMAVSHAAAQQTRDPLRLGIHILDRREKRVQWIFLVVFSLAFLAIAAGALLYFRGKSSSSSLAVADSIVTSVLYVELTVSAIYLLGLVGDFGTFHPVVFSCYFVVLAIICISAAILSIVGSLKPIPPFLGPILYLFAAILTMPVLTFSFLSTPDSSERFLAPRITLTSTSDNPVFSPPSEKPPIFDEFIASAEIAQPPRSGVNVTTRTIAVCILCGQISAVIHFAFAIALPFLHSQSSSPPKLTSEETTAVTWVETLVFRIIQTVFLVSWIICTMSAFLAADPVPKELLARVNHHSSIRSSMLTSSTVSDTTAFTVFPSPTAHRHRTSKSRSSSFSSPRPRRHPIIPRRSSPDDFQNLHDPFAPASASRTTLLPAPYASDTEGGGTRPTRMSAWGSLPMSPIATATPPRPPPNVLVINPPARGLQLPSLRDLAAGRKCVSVTEGVASASDNKSAAGRGRSMSVFSYTTPSAYNQDGGTAEGFDPAFDVEEAMLAQKLLRRLDAAYMGGRWNSLKLKRNGSAASSGQRP